MQLKPTDLKAVARVSGQVKDVTSSGARRNYWNSVHRLKLENGKLCLYTNDGSIWLEWNIPIEGGAGEDFDILLPAARFNDVATRSSEGGLYDVVREGGILLLKQGQRNLRLREDSPQQYLHPVTEGPQRSFTVPAAPLAKALAFVSPFIDISNPTPSRTVCTWDREGTLTGGAPKRIARVTGLPIPNEPMSFKQKNAKAVSAFLKQLEGDVQITIDDKHYTFECTLYHHKITVLGEPYLFMAPLRNIQGQETETYKMDTKMILSGVTILSTLLPAEADRLNLRFKGIGETASLRLSTNGDETRNSNDEFPIIRRLIQTGTDGLPTDAGTPEIVPDLWIAVNCRIFQEVLNQMEGTSLDAAYYQRYKMIYLKDEVGEANEMVRSLLVTVQPISEEEAAAELETKPADAPASAAQAETSTTGVATSA